MRKSRTVALSKNVVLTKSSRRPAVQLQAKNKNTPKQINSLFTLIGRPFYWLIIGLIFLIVKIMYSFTKLVNQILVFVKTNTKQLFKLFTSFALSQLNELILFVVMPNSFRHLILILMRSRNKFGMTENAKFVLLKFIKPVKTHYYINIYQSSKLKKFLKQLFIPIRLFWHIRRYRRVFPFIFIISLIVLVGCLAYPIWANLPDPNKLNTQTLIETTKIYDRKNRLLYKIYRRENRTIVNLNDIPKSLVNATIAIEDAEFYQHHGFSFKGIVRAAMANIREGKNEGGSTITQQLVKNTLLSPEQTFTRKIREMIVSVMVEQKFTKNQILQMYLNEVNYGGAAYGVEEASQMYFGKPVSQIDLAESALLAGLPASPTSYSPYGIHPELARERQQLVLGRMVEEKFISPKEMAAALAEKINFKLPQDTIKAPHFVMYIKDLLVKKYGERIVEEGGLAVYTSLDLDIQNEAENIVKNEIDKLQRMHISNGAALVTNPKTGEILAMVGSKNYFDPAIDGNVNVTLRERQPGSTIKVINYAVALQNGYTPSTIIADSPISFLVPGQPPYVPKNYDNRFHGNVPIRTALGSSYNVPAVKVLASVGINKMIEMGRSMGITSWEDPSRFGLSLTLGGGEVKMLDLATVYGTIANQGIRVEPNPIIAVKNNSGQDITKSPTPTLWSNNLKNNNLEKKVLPTVVAYQLTDILSDNTARTPAFGPHSSLNIINHPHIAVKTGTTTNMRDNWTIGYSPDFLVATWVGNNDNSPMSYVASGITGASPIWNKIMTYLVKDLPDKQFPLPPGLIRVKVCSLTNTLPCEGCPTKEELFEVGKEPKNKCNPEEIKTILSTKTD